MVFGPSIQQRDHADLIATFQPGEIFEIELVRGILVDVEFVEVLPGRQEVVDQPLSDPGRDVKAPPFTIKLVGRHHHRKPLVRLERLLHAADERGKNVCLVGHPAGVELVERAGVDAVELFEAFNQ